MASIFFSEAGGDRRTCFIGGQGPQVTEKNHLGVALSHPKRRVQRKTAARKGDGGWTFAGGDFAWEQERGRARTATCPGLAGAWHPWVNREVRAAVDWLQDLQGHRGKGVHTQPQQNRVKEGRRLCWHLAAGRGALLLEGEGGDEVGVSQPRDLGVKGICLPLHLSMCCMHLSEFRKLCIYRFNSYIHGMEGAL